MLWIIIAIVVSYLIGSIPTAYIFGRLLKGIDIRKFGSGNVGATNAVRVLGKGAGISVLAIDIFKGFFVAYFLGNHFSPLIPNISDEALRILLGVVCICGHNWTVFLEFKGGKGMAATLGVLLGLSVKISSLKLILGLGILAWILVFIITMIVSLASIASTLVVVISVFIFDQSSLLKLLSVVLCIFILLRHRNNIKRLLKGKEPRLYFKKSQSRK